MVSSIENLKELTKKLPELIHEFGKAAARTETFERQHPLKSFKDIGWKPEEKHTRLTC